MVDFKRKAFMCKRCSWANPKNPIYLKYHDEEWGVPLHDDRALFELLVLEGFQAGLSWECILNKREAFIEAFDSFDVDAVSKYDAKKCEELLQNHGIIRNKLKISAAVKNARVFKEIQREFGSFDRYIWRFTENRAVYEDYSLRTNSPLSDKISNDLKTRGMSFVGSTIIYSYLQAIGIIYAHGKECNLYKGTLL